MQKIILEICYSVLFSFFILSLHIVLRLASTYTNAPNQLMQAEVGACVVGSDVDSLSVTLN